jgi:hypothetical protein
VSLSRYGSDRILVTVLFNGTIWLDIQNKIGDRQRDKMWKEREMKRQSNRLDETVFSRQARYPFVMSFGSHSVIVVLIINIVELCGTL